MRLLGCSQDAPFRFTDMKCVGKKKKRASMHLSGNLVHKVMPKIWNCDPMEGLAICTAGVWVVGTWSERIPRDTIRGYFPRSSQQCSSEVSYYRLNSIGLPHDKWTLLPKSFPGSPWRLILSISRPCSQNCFQNAPGGSFCAFSGLAPKIAPRRPLEAHFEHF